MGTNSIIGSMNKMHEVLLELRTNQIIRRGKYSWQWKNKRKGLPSLANPITSKLFRADLVEEVNGEMIISDYGKSYINICIPTV